MDSCITGTAVQSLQTLVRHHSHYKPPAPRFGDKSSVTGRAVSLLTHTADFDSRRSRQQVLACYIFSSHGFNLRACFGLISVSYFYLAVFELVFYFVFLMYILYSVTVILITLYHWRV